MAYTTHSVTYGDKTIEATVTTKASVASNWVKHVKSLFNHYPHTVIVGLHCKWTPYPLRTLTNNIATLQLCVDTTCLILQLLYMPCGVPHSVAHFLRDPKFRFVGLEAEEVTRKLETEYGVALGNKVLDIRSLAKIHMPLSYHFHANIGFKALAACLLDLPACKPTTVPWKHLESFVLDDQAVITACVDAYVCYRIGQKLLNYM